MIVIWNVTLALAHVAAMSAIPIQAGSHSFSKLARICRNTIAMNETANIPDITAGQATQLMKYASLARYNSTNYEEYVTSIGVAYSVGANGYYLDRCLTLLERAFHGWKRVTSFVPKRDYRDYSYRTSQEDIAEYLCTIFERTHSRKVMLVVLRVPGDGASGELLEPYRYEFWKKFPTMILELLSENPALIPQVGRNLAGNEVMEGWKPRLKPSFKRFLRHKNPIIAGTATRLLKAYEEEASRNPNGL